MGNQSAYNIVSLFALFKKCLHRHTVSDGLILYTVDFLFGFQLACITFMTTACSNLSLKIYLLYCRFKCKGNLLNKTYSYELSLIFIFFSCWWIQCSTPNARRSGLSRICCRTTCVTSTCCPCGSARGSWTQGSGRTQRKMSAWPNYCMCFRQLGGKRKNLRNVYIQ